MRPLSERFWPKVDVRGPDECWPWRAGRTWGYGVIGRGGRTGGQVRAHRFAYEQLVGPIPVGLVIDHLCRNRCCCNPAHMEPVTNAENVLRGNSPTAMAARRTSCVHGHPLEGPNLHYEVTRNRVARRCVTCRRATDLRRAPHHNAQKRAARAAASVGVMA